MAARKERRYRFFSLDFLILFYQEKSMNHIFRSRNQFGMTVLIDGLFLVMLELQFFMRFRSSTSRKRKGSCRNRNDTSFHVMLSPVLMHISIVSASENGFKDAVQRTPSESKSISARHVIFLLFTDRCTLIADRCKLIAALRSLFPSNQFMFNNYWMRIFHTVSFFLFSYIVHNLYGRSNFIQAKTFPI